MSVYGRLKLAKQQCWYSHFTCCKGLPKHLLAWTLYLQVVPTLCFLLVLSSLDLLLLVGPVCCYFSVISISSFPGGPPRLISRWRHCFTLLYIILTHHQGPAAAVSKIARIHLLRSIKRIHRNPSPKLAQIRPGDTVAGSSHGYPRPDDAITGPGGS